MIERLIDLVLKDIWRIVSPLWECTVMWRVIGLVLLSAIVLAVMKREHIAQAILGSEEMKEHDRRIFETLDGILSEGDLDGFLNDVLMDHSYRSSRGSAVDKFLDVLTKESTQFRNKKLREDSTRLRKVLGELDNFIGTHFFPYPQRQQNQDIRCCLYPEFCLDRSGDGSPEKNAFYNEHSEELKKIGFLVDPAYKKWRRCVKEALNL